jgi:hypothetical protein
VLRERRIGEANGRARLERAADNLATPAKAQGGDKGGELASHL